MTRPHRSRSPRKQDPKRPGFTIVELLIVVVVIAILAAITVVAYNGITRQANHSALASSLQQTAKKVVAEFTMNSDTYPTALADIGITNSGDTTYQYAVNTASPVPNYCITITKGSGSSAKIGHIAGARNSVNQAVPDVPCNDHVSAATIAKTTAAVTNAALGCPAGYIAVPGNSLFDQRSFCVMKYEAKNVGGVPTSQAAGTPWASISQVNVLSTIQSTLASDYQLMSGTQHLTLSHNIINIGSNWTGGTVGSGVIFRGHTDNVPGNALAAAADSNGYSGTGQTTGDQRRTHTLSNGEVIWDLAGNVYEMTSQTTEGAGSQTGHTTDFSYSSRDWNEPNLQPGSFATSFPAFGTPAAAAWTSAQNIGQPYGNYSDSELRAIFRGGNWGSGGILTVYLGAVPTYASSPFGFRVAR